MKHIPTLHILVSAAVLAVLAAGCGDDDPAAPGSHTPAPFVQFQIDLNSDVVVNNGTGALDVTQEAVDDSTGVAANFAYLTQSAAEEKFPSSPNGLPDDAFFPANDDHPDVRLAYRNNSNGHNARRIMTNGETYTINTGGEKFSEVHLFMAAGQGSAAIQVHLDYDGLGVTRNATVYDWFVEVPSNGSAYYLIDGMDRIKRDATTFENRDDAAIFGFDVGVDSTYALQSVTITRSASNSTGMVLVLFGATGVRAKGDAPPSK